MHDLIRRLVQWLSLLFGPGTGSRRAGDLRPPGLTVGTLCLPLHCSPYSRHLPLDGNESLLARPYLTAHEKAAA